MSIASKDTGWAPLNSQIQFLHPLSFKKYVTIQNKIVDPLPPLAVM